MRMKVALTTILLSLALALGQEVQAPNALKIRITKVTSISEPTHEVSSDKDKQVSESTLGYKLVGENNTARYSLSCIIRTRTERFVGGYTSTEVDGQPETFLSPVCKGFHVGTSVVFYSVENLVWLSETNSAGKTFVPGSGWKPVYMDDQQKEFVWWQWETGLTKPGFTAPQIMFQKAYSIDSEEERPTQKKGLRRGTTK
jgi:hypothetical protein